MEGNPVSINWNVTQRAIENCQGSKQPILLVPDTHQYLLSEEAYMEARDDDKYVQRWRLPEVCSIAHLLRLHATLMLMAETGL